MGNPSMNPNKNEEHRNSGQDHSANPQSIPAKKEENFLDKLSRKIELEENVHEALRDTVYEAVKASEEFKKEMAEEDFDTPSNAKAELIEEKKRELYTALENLDQELAGKDAKEVAAFFSSLLNIQSQLCLQKTEGVISIRVRISDFFPTIKQTKALMEKFRQELSLIFTPGRSDRDADEIRGFR